MLLILNLVDAHLLGHIVLCSSKSEIVLTQNDNVC